MELALEEAKPHGQAYTVEEKRERYPRAYEKWTDSEDAEFEAIGQIWCDGRPNCAVTPTEIRAAIRSRIMKLGLVGDLLPKEQTRFQRIMERTGELPGD